MLRSLLAPNGYPVADAFQVLNGDPASSVFRFLHNMLTDAVVGIRLITRLFTRQIAEFSFCGLSSFLLKITAAVSVFPALFINRRATVSFAVRIGGQINDAQVNAKKISDILRFRRLDFAGNKEIELAADVAQISLSAFAFQQFALSFATFIDHVLAALKRLDAYDLIGNLEAQDAIVIRERAVWPKDSLSFLVHFIGHSNLGNSPHRNLGGQVKPVTECSVNQMMQSKLIKGLCFPCSLAGIIASGIGRLKRFKQSLVLFQRGAQFDFSS